MSVMSIYNLHSYSGMNQPSGPIASGIQDELWAAAQCRDAVAALERAIAAPPLQLTREANNTVRMILRMRDKMNEWLRQEGRVGDENAYLRAINRLNSALALLTNMQYPATGIRRKPVEQARDMLQSILLDGLF
jgi:hypothetical protein